MPDTSMPDEPEELKRIRHLMGMGAALIKDEEWWLFNHVLALRETLWAIDEDHNTGEHSEQVIALLEGRLLRQ